LLIIGNVFVFVPSKALGKTILSTILSYDSDCRKTTDYIKILLMVINFPLDIGTFAVFLNFLSYSLTVIVIVNWSFKYIIKQFYCTFFFLMESLLWFICLDVWMSHFSHWRSVLWRRKNNLTDSYSYVMEKNEWW
jgi:hypothetical protein